MLKTIYSLKNYFKETSMQPPLKETEHYKNLRSCVSFSNHNSPLRKSPSRPRDYYNPDFMVITALLLFSFSQVCFLNDIVLLIFKYCCLC